LKVLTTWGPVDGSVDCPIGTLTVGVDVECIVGVSTVGVDVVVALGFWSLVKMISSSLCSGASDSLSGMRCASKQVISRSPASIFVPAKAQF
jgi:hypothetical protein